MKNMPKFKFIEARNRTSLPSGAGVYVFKNKRNILYIGKSSNIRRRVKNHFQQPDFRDKFFIGKINQVGYIKTNSEIEALILETQLIKKYKPKYNIVWRDDKNYFYVGITKEDFPRIFITHQPIKTPKSQSTEYIGPFVDGKALKQTLKVLRKVFPYRTCKKIPHHPCLWYELKRCVGPCILNSKTAQQIPCLREKIKKTSQQNIKNLVKVLQGKRRQLLKDLKKQMEQFSRTQEFEAAAKTRDQINALKNVLQHANIFTSPDNTTLIQRRLNYKELWKKSEKHLRDVLGIKQRIKRIEGYDISNIQGKEATGSMVVFKNGTSSKNEYRKFKIKISGKPNDVAMMYEVLKRRTRHIEWDFPQIMLIDGGKAQLNAAIRALMELKSSISKKIKVLSLAKRKNDLYIQGEAKPIPLSLLPQDISNLFLRIRDEAHRFAISYHRKLRRKKMIGK